MRETYSRNMAPAVRAEETVREGDVGSVSTYRLSDLSFAIIGLWIPKNPYEYRLPASFEV